MSHEKIDIDPYKEVSLRKTYEQGLNPLQSLTSHLQLRLIHLQHACTPTLTAMELLESNGYHATQLRAGPRSA